MITVYNINSLYIHTNFKKNPYNTFNFVERACMIGLSQRILRNTSKH